MRSRSTSRSLRIPAASLAFVAGGALALAAGTETGSRPYGCSVES